MVQIPLRARVTTGITTLTSAQPGGGVKVIRTATAPLLSSLTNHVKMVVNQSGLGQTSEVAVQKTVHQLLLGL